MSYATVNGCTPANQKSPTCFVQFPPHPKFARPLESLRCQAVAVLPVAETKRTVQQYHDKIDLIQSLEPWVGSDIEPMLVPSSKCWQPSDMLPDSASPDFLEHLQGFREECKLLPSEFLVVLVGDMVTEEALPSYMSMLNRMDGCKDASGGDDTAWGRWNRGWTSEENRHGDLLNKYLYLSGRVDMRAIEQSIQSLIGSGFDPQLSTDPYLEFVYTSFQERATKISHRNSARLAQQAGAPHLAAICNRIAGDEARHEAAYQKIMSKLFKQDPDSAVLAFADMMSASIVMPAHLMQDGGPGIDAATASDSLVLRSFSSRPGRDSRTEATRTSHQSLFFKRFSALAESMQVYTALDYANCLDHLLSRWKIADLQVASGEAAAAQEYLLKHGPRMKRMASIMQERADRARSRSPDLPQSSFKCAWVHNSEVYVR